MPLRPVLPPGCDVVRRDRRTLLVGTRPGVVVPDRPGLVEVLRLLDGRTVDSLAPRVARQVPAFDADLPALLTELVARGALADAAPVRHRAVVDVRPGPGAARSAAAVAEAVADVADPAGHDVDLVVLVSAGEPDRRHVADVVSAGVPTLPVSVGTTWTRVGPLTVLGSTPCLGCHDAERARWDPAWRAVVPQLGRPVVAAAPARPDPALLWRAAGEVATDVAAFADGRRARSVGGVVTVTADGAVREPVPLSARCGCLLRRRA